MAWKLFVDNETFDLNEAQDLMNQGVVPYASSAARAAELTSPVVGQLTIFTTTGELERWDGSNWVPLPPTSLSGMTQTGTLTQTASGIGRLTITYPTPFPASLPVPVPTWQFAPTGSSGGYVVDEFEASRTGFWFDAIRSNNFNTSQIQFDIYWHAVALP